jgi:hypothetical protein
MLHRTLPSIRLAITILYRTICTGNYGKTVSFTFSHIVTSTTAVISAYQLATLHPDSIYQLDRSLVVRAVTILMVDSGYLFVPYSNVVHSDSEKKTLIGSVMVKVSLFIIQHSDNPGPIFLS